MVRMGLLGFFAVFLLPLSCTAMDTVGRGDASKIEYSIPNKISFTNVPSSGRPVFLAKYDVVGDIMRLYLGSPDLCSSVTVCALSDGEEITQENGTRKYDGSHLCNTSFDIMRLIPAAKSIQIRKSGGSSEEFFSTQLSVIFRTNAKKTTWKFSHNTGYKYFDADPLAEKTFSMKSPLLVMGSSKQCPLYLYGVHDVYKPLGYEGSIELAPPTLFTRNEKKLDLIIKSSVTNGKFTDNCCERIEDLEYNWKPSKTWNPGMRAQLYTVKTIPYAADPKFTPPSPVNALSIEVAMVRKAKDKLRREVICPWIRVCFDYRNGNACKDPKKTLDLMIRKGVYIPTDTDEAFKFAAPPEELAHIMLRFHNNTIMEMGYGPVSHDKVYSPGITHSMRLNYAPSNSDSKIVLITPNKCTARLTRKSTQSGSNYKSHYVNTHVIKCQCQKLK